MPASYHANEEFRVPGLRAQAGNVASAKPSRRAAGGKADELDGAVEAQEEAAEAASEKAEESDVASTVQLTWRRVTPSGAVPCARSGHAMCAVNGKLLLHGGVGATRSRTRDWPVEPDPICALFFPRLLLSDSPCILSLLTQACSPTLAVSLSRIVALALAPTLALSLAWALTLFSLRSELCCSTLYFVFCPACFRYRSP
eukprot:1466627-Pleurochrysis_carterae.AAC.1